MMRRTLFGFCLALACAVSQPALAQGSDTYSSGDLVSSGHSFFGGLSSQMAQGIEYAVGRWGHPQAYIVGQEGSGAFIGGLRYGEGTLRSKRGDNLKIFWQGPSIGFDAGGNGDRMMMLVYNANGPRSLLRRFVGLAGSAYLIGGVGITAVGADNIIIVPIRAGVGARLGANVGYLKFTDQATWNPF